MRKYHYGQIHPEDPSVDINKSLPVDEQIITLLHELIHNTYPEASEDDVELYGYSLYSALTERQFSFLEWILYESAKFSG